MGANARSTVVLIKLCSSSSGRDGEARATTAQAYATVWRTALLERPTDTPPGTRVCSGKVSGWKVIIVAALAVAGLVSACGGTEQNPGEHHGRFPVSVTSSFQTSQRLAQQTRFTVTVRNTGHRTIPNVAVTVTNPRYGSAAQSFGTLLAPNAAGQPILASRSRPVWIINRAPGPCGYSCRAPRAGRGSDCVFRHLGAWLAGARAHGHVPMEAHRHSGRRLHGRIPDRGGTERVRQGGAVRRRARARPLQSDDLLDAAADHGPERRAGGPAELISLPVASGPPGRPHPDPGARSPHVARAASR